MSPGSGAGITHTSFVCQCWFGLILHYVESFWMDGCAFVHRIGTACFHGRRGRIEVKGVAFCSSLIFGNFKMPENLIVSTMYCLSTAHGT